MLLAQRLQCLNDESAFRKSEASLFPGSVIKNKSSASDAIRPIRTIRQVNCPCGHLRGKAEQVLCDSAARLDSPTEFACERLCNLVDVGAQVRREQFAELRTVINPAAAVNYCFLISQNSPFIFNELTPCERVILQSFQGANLRFAKFLPLL